jgi:D-inositol-3-phosphate glycosyltransferase
VSERRIAFLSEHASPLALLGGTDAGGQNVYVDELSRHLGTRGYTVDVYTRWDAQELPLSVEWAPNVNVINIRVGRPTPLEKDRLWPHMPAFRDEILRHISRFGLRYDVIHGNFWMSGWVATELGRMLGVPVVQIFHAMGRTKQKMQGTADTSPLARIPIEEQVVRIADRLIAQCPGEERELLDDYAAPRERVALIPSAVNAQRFQPVDRAEARATLGIDGDGPIVGYVGRMLPRKDVRNVVRATALLRDMPAPVRLLLVGGESEEPDPASTPETGVLQQLAGDLGIADRVIFAGKRQPDVLRYYYSACDVLVTTPWYEPFGLTPLEAMACGRPVIGSNVGGITFTIEHGGTGFHVPPGNPDALAARLRDLLADDALRERMGAAGRRRVLTKFTWPVVATRTAALYEELIAERHDAGSTGLVETVRETRPALDRWSGPGQRPATRL